MTFVQIIDCKTDRVDDMNRLLDKWVEQTHGKRTATHATVATDRADSHHVIEIVEFPSYEEAKRQSNLPETNRIFEEMVALCDMPPTFTDLDVVRDEQLNKMVCQRFYEIITKGEFDALEQVLDSGYREFDPNNEEQNTSIDMARAEVQMYHAAFSDFRFTLDDQIAEGDKVCNRWTWTGKHTGEFLGIGPTKRKVTMTGTTIHRLENGKIQEAWWSYDFLGALRQIGAVNMSQG
jgi:steroid delta-isomerase-like uncharacterized protein